MVIAHLLFAIAIIFWMITELWIRIREGTTAITKNDQYSKLVIVITVIFAVFLSTFIAARASLPIIGDNTFHFLTGFFIIIIAVSLRIWSVRTLGNFFRTTVMIQEKHIVISNGPYKYIRHPSYAAVLLATVGVGIGEGNWAILLVLPMIIFIGLRYRIFVEEKVLNKNLGKSYQEYMKRTKMIIPFVY